MTAMRQRSNKQHRSADGGFVLIAVLWMLTLIALLTTALTHTARLDIRAGANRRERRSRGPRRWPRVVSVPSRLPGPV